MTGLIKEATLAPFFTVWYSTHQENISLKVKVLSLGHGRDISMAANNMKWGVYMCSEVA